jgi:hypothetical protein
MCSVFTQGGVLLFVSIWRKAKKNLLHLIVEFKIHLNGQAFDYLISSTDACKSYFQIRTEQAVYVAVTATGEAVAD